MLYAHITKTTLAVCIVNIYYFISIGGRITPNMYVQTPLVLCKGFDSYCAISIQSDSIGGIIYNKFSVLEIS